MRGVIAAFFTGIILSAAVGSVAAAAPNTFVQQILPTDCTLTLVGQQVVGECPTDVPVVVEVAKNASGMRVVRGLFDQSRTTLLRVVFNGVIYTAGVAGSPLSYSGDSWEFNVDRAVPNMPSGAYTFIVLATNLDGEVLTATATVDILAVTVPKGGLGTGGTPITPPQSSAWGLLPLPTEFHASPGAAPSLDPGNGVRVWIDDGASKVSSDGLRIVSWTLGVLGVIVLAVFVTRYRNRGKNQQH